MLPTQIFEQSKICQPAFASNNVQFTFFGKTDILPCVCLSKIETRGTHIFFWQVARRVRGKTCTRQIKILHTKLVRVCEQFSCKSCSLQLCTGLCKIDMALNWESNLPFACLVCFVVVLIPLTGKLETLTWKFGTFTWNSQICLKQLTNTISGPTTLIFSLQT